jgi:alginate O-acetyltransferase complex protein AlgI
MLFDSIHFAFFLPLVFILYWFVFNKKLSTQNILLLVSSYFFYACWDYRFLFLLIFSTLLDYYTGLKMHQSKETRTRKGWFWLSVIINLGFLCVFKYYNFFIESFSEFAGNFGIKTNFSTIKLILPVGISFYTFHGLSYVIDIYKRRIEPVTNFIDYSVFVSFFPLLVAGPIERATHLLPQIQYERKFNYAEAVDGLKQILWGLFKKIVIADSCASASNMIFDQYSTYSGSTLFIGALLFAFQIYGDFSGYSDIALGTAKLFGIRLLRNFAYPYFSRDIAEFWRRWHISLSSWFKDYLYIPLGGSKGGTWKKIRNTFIIFIVSGFWHGANWTFIAWGVFHALCFLPLLLINKNRNHIEIVAKGRYLPSFKDVLNISLTFFLVVIAWVFFRAENLTVAFQYLSGIFSKGLLKAPEIFPKSVLILVSIFMIIEWLGREHDFAIANLGFLRFRPMRWLFYSSLIFIVFIYTESVSQPFIYFQF